MHRDCELYRAEGFQALSKIEIRKNSQKPVLAVLNIVDDSSIVTPEELGVSLQTFQQLAVPEGGEVSVCHAEPPESMEAVRRKINGERLTQQDFLNIAHDIEGNRYSKMEIAAFLVASGQTSLERDEILYLTRAMLETGSRLEWKESQVVDKHCIGGIPGNRTSMLVVPIVAAHGMLIPKTSSRAITSPSGTADTMETLCNVNLSPDRLHEVIAEQRGCLAWGGTAQLAPVDDKLITVERPLSIDSHGQMVASILSKKLAAGSTHLLIDIPVGPTAKVRSMQEALSLRKLFEFVGDKMNLHLEVMITDGRQPIGRGIGPALEARDVMMVLENLAQAPTDLREKALQLSGRIIEFGPDVRGGQGYAIARDILDSGRALEKVHAIIKAQGAKENVKLEGGQLSYNVIASRSGVVSSIDNLQMARIARMAGAPLDKQAGVDLLKKLGESVEQGEPLYTIYAEFNSDFQFAKNLCQSNNGYDISDEYIKPKSYFDNI